MPFNLIEIEVKQALKQPGCPICRIYRQAADRYLRNLLWENVTDFETRKWIIASLGYCAEHTLQLATIETHDYGDAMGISIVYENLAQALIQRLESWRPAGQRRQGMPALLKRATRWLKNLEKSPRVLSTQIACRVCQIANESEKYALPALMHELNTPIDGWWALYGDSDGLCLRHLRLCLEKWSPQYPAAAELLRQDTLGRLNCWSVDMREYVRKHAWNNRNEILTEAENKAWSRTLAFFTGYPPEIFTAGAHRETNNE